jgi:hypothetical protein
MIQYEIDYCSITAVTGLPSFNTRSFSKLLKYRQAALNLGKFVMILPFGVTVEQ